jgi:hypothetical protein
MVRDPSFILTYITVAPKGDFEYLFKALSRYSSKYLFMYIS